MELKPLEDCKPTCHTCGQTFDTQSQVCTHVRHSHPLKSHPTKFLFKGRTIDAKKTVRVGICSKCGKKGYTHLHHEQYNSDDPLEHTVELCAKCHGLETKKQLSNDKV